MNERDKESYIYALDRLIADCAELKWRLERVRKRTDNCLAESLYALPAGDIVALDDHVKQTVNQIQKLRTGVPPNSIVKMKGSRWEQNLRAEWYSGA